MNITKSQAVAADVSALLRARNPLIWIVSREEARVERYLVEAAAAAGYAPRTWDVAQGFVAGGVKFLSENEDPGAALATIASRATTTNPNNTDRGLWIMRDLPAWLTGPGGVTTLRQLRNLARLLPGCPRDRAQAVIILSPSGDVPAELSGHATVIEWPLPDSFEVSRMRREKDGITQFVPFDRRLRTEIDKAILAGHLRSPAVLAQEREAEKAERTTREREEDAKRDAKWRAQARAAIGLQVITLLNDSSSMTDGAKLVTDLEDRIIEAMKWGQSQ